MKMLFALHLLGMLFSLVGHGSAPPITRLDVVGLNQGQIGIAWQAVSNAAYALEPRDDLASRFPRFEHIRAEGKGVRSVDRAKEQAFFRVAAQGDSVGVQSMLQCVDDFSWALEADPTGLQQRDYRHYNRLDAQRGRGGNPVGNYSVTITNEALHLQATEGAFGFVFNSLVRGTADPGTLNFAAPLPAWVQAPYQMPIQAIQVVGRGTGRLKFELKDAQNQVLWLHSLDLSSPATWITNQITLSDLSALGEVKFFNWVGMGPCNLVLDRVCFIHEVAAWLHDDPMRYAFVTSYAALLRAYDPATDRTRDKVHLSAGDFDSLPASGFQALTAVMAADLDVISRIAARQIVSKSVAALAAAPRYHGLPPHWMKSGQPVNYSTVDAALALISALQAAAILEMEPEQSTLENLIQEIEWTPLVNARQEVSHGYAADLSVLPYVWTPWGGESSLVQVLRLLQDTNAALFRMDTHPPVFGGRGFIVELAALLVPQFGYDDVSDIHEVNWREERLRMLALNRQWFPIHYPGSVAAEHGWFGLSVVEIIAGHASTSYLEGGLGAAGVSARDGGGWLAPHYAAMTANLEPSAASQWLRSLQDAGLLQPMIGLPESIRAGNAGNFPERWHSVQVTLNAFFATAGLYHAIRARDGGKDLVYECARRHPRLSAALARLFNKR